MFNYAFLKTLTVLYVESEESTNKYFSNILLKKFKSVICTRTGKEALGLLEKNKNEDFNIDIIICDEKLIDISGLDVLRKIRETKNDINFILTTNKIEVNDVLKAIEYKASDYLEKPINAKDLVFSVEHICQNKYHKKMKYENYMHLKDIKTVINQIALVTKTDLDGKITFANYYFCDVSGYTQEELIGLTYDIIKPDDTNSLVYKNLLEIINQGKIWEGKLKKISKEKEEFYIYLTVVPIFKNNSDIIKEFMWISFLSTKDELEQKEFKKKVAQNIHSTRRINTEAREKIDTLLEKLSSYKYLDSLLINEEERSAKFANQIKFNSKEVKEIEDKLKEISQKATIKIKKVVKDEKETREKKNKVDEELNKLTVELDLKNADIAELTKELNTQVKIVNKLLSSINNKEHELGL